MPVMNYNPRTFSDPSTLSEGTHPAFLIEVVEEAVPQGWAMGEKDPMMWRWNFAVWHNPQDIVTTAPELQSMVSSRTFSSGGKYQPSKAFVNMRALLNRDIPKGEALDPNDLVPLPGMLYITRRDKQGQQIDFANVKDLAPWPEGHQYLTPEVKEKLRAWWTKKQEGLASAHDATPSPAPASPMAPAPSPAPAPLQGGTTATPAMPTKSGW